MWKHIKTQWTAIILEREQLKKQHKVKYKVAIYFPDPYEFSSSAPQQANIHVKQTNETM